MIRALIDGDVLRYRCGFAAQDTQHEVWIAGQEDQGPIATYDKKKEAKEYAKDIPDAYITPNTTPEPVANCLHSVKLQVLYILNQLQTSKYTVYLSGERNYRDEIAPDYKANRDPDHKPIHYDAITEYLRDNWKAKVVDGQEADDAMGIEQWTQHPLVEMVGLDYQRASAKTIICTIDKDMDMIPGWHYNFVKDNKYWVTEHEAIRFFYSQMLTGDRVDNIPGVPGIGPVKAAKILAGAEDYEEMYERVQDQYEARGMGDSLLPTARLLWIRREPDEMWEPPTGGDDGRRTDVEGGN